VHKQLLAKHTSVFSLTRIFALLLNRWLAKRASQQLQARQPGNEEDELLSEEKKAKKKSNKAIYGAERRAKIAADPVRKAERKSNRAIYDAERSAKVAADPVRKAEKKRITAIYDAKRTDRR
jgi:hypothetical protein